MLLNNIVNKHLRIHFLIRLSIFWLIFFTIFRIVFIVENYERLPENNFLITSLSLLEGARLDFSTIAYLLVFPYVLWALQQFLKNRIVHKLNLFYNSLLILFFTLISLANIRLYRESGTLLNYRMFDYFHYPKKILASTPFSSIIVMFAFTAVFVVGYIFIYKKMVTNFSFSSEKNAIKISLIAMFPFALFIMARGGVQRNPINESSAFYSNIPIHNHIATNDIWHLAHSFLNARDTKNEYESLEQSK